MSGMSVERLEEIRAGLPRVALTFSEIFAGPHPGGVACELVAEVDRLRRIFKLIAGSSACERWSDAGARSDDGTTHGADGKPLEVPGHPSCLEDATPSSLRCVSCKARGALGLAAGDEIR